MLAAATKPVSIDIEPGEYPNTINLGSKGNVPLAILSSESLDATQVDPLTVTLAGAHVALRGKGTRATLTDAKRDGLLDLVVHVETEALELSPDDTEASRTSPGPIPSESFPNDGPSTDYTDEDR